VKPFCYDGLYPGWELNRLFCYIKVRISAPTHFMVEKVSRNETGRVSMTLMSRKVVI